MGNKMVGLRAGMLAHVKRDGCEYWYTLLRPHEGMDGYYDAYALRDNTAITGLEAFGRDVISTNSIEELYDFSEGILNIHTVRNIIRDAPTFRETFRVWARRQVREMTVSEISEALGYEVKVVKEH